MKHLIAPSLLAADFTCLQKEIEMVNRSRADWLHLDIMDGRFVPNITFGMLIIQAVKKITEKPLDAHLMIVEPQKYIGRMRDAGADVITVHYEACTHLHSVVHQIKESGAKAGVALNPHTPVSVLYDLLEDIDMVLIMSVNPGFGGQKFIPRTIQRIQQLKERILVQNTNTLIEIDGGVSLQNAGKIIRAGADVLVAGSSVFRSDDPEKSIRQLKELSSIQHV